MNFIELLDLDAPVFDTSPHTGEQMFKLDDGRTATVFACSGEYVFAIADDETPLVFNKYGSEQTGGPNVAMPTVVHGPTVYFVPGTDHGDEPWQASSEDEARTVAILCDEDYIVAVTPIVIFKDKSVLIVGRNVRLPRTEAERDNADLSGEDDANDDLSQTYTDQDGYVIEEL